MSTMREASKATWTSANSVDHINAGSLQRIADACELMAANYDEMRRDRDYWKQKAVDRMADWQAAERSIRSLRGVITKLKRAADPGVSS